MGHPRTLRTARLEKAEFEFVWCCSETMLQAACLRARAASSSRVSVA